MTGDSRSGRSSGVVPLFAQELLYVGIDVGKQHHVAGFLSTTLLQRHERFEACPVLTFEQSREGFRSLVERMSSFSPIEQCYVLLEHTGHYHLALEQYLQELDIAVFKVHVQRRPPGLLKTDKRDALGLANTLYNQLEKGIQVADKLQLVRRTLPPTEAASQLRGLMRHRYELIQESTQRKNKLTSICDQLFPELVQVFKNPNLPTPLAIRERYPTPYAIATASLTALQALKERRYPSDAQLLELQRLAAQSIGVKEVHRLRSLVFEQDQLIKEMKLLHQHLAALETEIYQIVEQSREGRILTSIPGVGLIPAATVIASIGTIANFESAAALKSYFGWAPALTQSGTSLDRASLTQRGTRPMKKMMYLVVWTAIKMDCEWAQLYQRLVHLKCPYDERTRRHTGKTKIIGRIAGQMIAMMFALLKTDYELMSRPAPGRTPPDPLLYDAEVHKRHRNGQYRALKPQRLKQTIIQPLSQ